MAPNGVDSATQVLQTRQPSHSPGWIRLKSFCFHPGGRELLVQRQAAQIKALPPPKISGLNNFGRRLLKSASLVIHEPTRHPYNALPFNVRNADYAAKWNRIDNASNVWLSELMGRGVTFKLRNTECISRIGVLEIFAAPWRSRRCERDKASKPHSIRPLASNLRALESVGVSWPSLCPLLAVERNVIAGEPLR
jgi:hypothetical protein